METKQTMMRKLADAVVRHKVGVLWGVFAGLYYIRFIRRPAGVTLYPIGADALLHNAPLETYAPGFTYPPLFAFLMIPFSPLPMWLRNLLWYVLLAGATWLCFRLCEQIAQQTFAWRPEGRHRFWFRLLSVVLSLKVTLAVFENQAFDILVFLCLLFGLHGLMNRRSMVAAVGLAAAAALKVTPLLFFPYLLLRRQFKVFFLAVAVYAGISFLPDLFFTPRGATSGYFVTWVRDVAGSAVFQKRSAEQVQVRHWDHASGLNQSLRSLVFQLTSEASGNRHSRMILNVVYLVYAALVFILLLRSARITNGFALDSCLLLISMLMLSPMSSKSHFVVLMLPYMLLIAATMAEPSWRRLGITLLGFSFALITLTSRDIVGKRLSDTFLESGCVAIGTLMLLLLIIYIIFAWPGRSPSAACKESERP